MNKTIQINPDLFKVGTTRKRSTVPKNLSVRVPKEASKTLSKRNALIKFIRRHQDSNIKKDISQENNDPEEINESDSDFEKSLQYLMDITDSPPENSKTMKNHRPHEVVNMHFPEHHSQSIQPQYGCLKNGNLPTYRQFYNRQTMKNHTGMGNATNNTQPHNLECYSENYDSQPLNNTDVLGISSTFDHDDEGICSEPTPQNDVDDKTIDDTNTQRKILTRTYKIGKSESNRKVSVLVSNKTLRHQASNKSITLKKTHMNDVKKFLVKRGLVKIGTTAPPDVLRKMYESASMVCGDITNHNPETLMYNFLNPEKKSW